MTAAAPWWRRVAVVLVIVVATGLGGATPASAHPTLLFTDPAADTAAPTSPPVISLVFGETVTVGPRAVVVLGSDGRPVPMGPASTARDGTVVTARPTGVLPPGTYLLRWRVTGSDGDLVDEEFSFAVGTAISGGATASGVQPISWGAAVLRWLLFTGLAMALGGLIGERFTTSARAEKPTLPPVRSWALPGALLGLAGVLGLAALLVTETAAVSTLWHGRVGRLLLAEGLGLAVAAGLTAVRGSARAWAVLPLALVAVAEGLRSHANLAAPGWGVVLTGLHLAAVAVWVGALLHVLRAALRWRREPPAVRWVLLGYLRLAAWAFVIVIGTGTITALVLVRLSAMLTSAYGQILLIKLALVVVAAGVALTARRTSGDSLGHRDRLDRVRTLTRVESTVLVAVLALSAVLVSTPPASSQQLAPPAPPHGLVVPLGALAGQVGVSVAASQDQLVVRLSTPRRGDYYAPQPAQDYALSGQVSANRRGTTALEFRGCGPGCFVSTVIWRDGDNVATLRVDAPGWRGGAVSLLIGRPARPGADELARSVEALRAAARITVYETVTSDTATGAGAPKRLDLDGSFFVAQQPYASGAAPITVRISQDGQPVRLALGYPAAGINVALTLDDNGRISTETLTDRTHLIHRRFTYPDG